MQKTWKIMYTGLNSMTPMIKPFIPVSLPLSHLRWENFVHLIGPANAEVARFDGSLQSLPNPQVLLSPLETNEAVLSSKIEGTQATLEEVLRFEADPKAPTQKGTDIDLILNYRGAMRHCIQRMREVSLSGRLIREAHQILLENVRGHNADRGHFRKNQVHIGRPGRPVEEATYVPPPPQNIASLFSNFELYIHSEEKDKLVNSPLFTLNLN
jgi:Fic family protein